jgi:acetyltransferase
MLTDLCVSHGLEMAELSQKTVDDLKKLWPNLTIRSNPVDLAFLDVMDSFGDVARIVLADENVDSVIVFYLDVSSLFTAVVSEQLIPIANEAGKPVVMCVNFPTRLSGKESDEGFAKFHANGIATYPLPERAVKALKGLVRRGEIERSFGQS